MSRRRYISIAIATALTLVGGCSDDGAGTARPETTTSSSAPSEESGLAASIRSTDWANATVPAAPCAGAGSVTLHDGFGVVSSERWTDAWQGRKPPTVPGQVEIEVYADDGIVYGDVDGDGVDEAAVHVWCTNGGGTSGGQLAQNVVVFQGDAEFREVLGVLPMVHQTSLGATYGRVEQIGGGTVTITEYIHGPDDPQSFPTGTAETVWAYDGNGFVQSSSRITKEPNAHDPNTDQTD
jgi:hypothetical protein